MSLFEPLVIYFSAYPSFFFVTVGLFGLLVGSFLNVVIYRLPIMMQREWQTEFIAYFKPKDLPEPPGGVPLDQPFSLSIPRSACPKCKALITASENIPILSYVLKRGRCQHCQNPIPIRYPVVEAVTALISVWCAWHFGPTVQCAVMLLVSWMLISAVVIDLDHMLLPDQLTLPLLWIGLLVATQGVFVSLHDAVIGAALGYFILWSIYWGFKLLTGKEGMGYGDFKLLSALGAFVGWQYLLVIILLSSVVALVIAIGAMAISNKTSTTNDETVPAGAFPFGPFLGIAGWLTILYGDSIVETYFSLMGLS